MINEIPLTNQPNQTFSATIAGEKRNLLLIITQFYNEQAGYWVLGIYDQSGTPIVLSIPLLCGHDLLEQYQYLNIGSLIVVNIGDQTIENPSDTNIENNFELVWVLQ